MKKPIFTGLWGNCHIQGIDVDKEKGFIYYSFTTKLVKATLDGKIIGSVDGLVGHLGCIAFNRKNGMVYGSLEYKNDFIGREILANLGVKKDVKDAFYIAIFDVDKIDRLGMSAEEDGIMKCVYLKEVVDDYLGKGDKGAQHKYGCSGIDGTTFAPLPSKTDTDDWYLYVAYGVYADKERSDNDNQVLLCYDISDWDKYAQPLNQDNMHTFGPKAPLHKYFVYTGNTCYGVQNLEYDPYKKAMLMAVYRGNKPSFPNYSLFAADMTVSPKREIPKGLDSDGEILSLVTDGEHQNGIYGWNFPYGSTGLCSLGEGKWMISHNYTVDGQQCADIYSYKWDGDTPFILE